MSTRGSVQPFEEWAREALQRYNLLGESTLTLLNVSENATFLVETETERRILRVHRADYHSLEEIESELDWVDAICESGDITVAECIRSEDGRRVVQAESHNSEIRNCVMFTFIPGREPAEADLLPAFSNLGAVTARLHAHAQSWSQPASFIRKRWDFDTTIGGIGHWGHWRDGMGVSPAEVSLFSTTTHRIGQFLSDYGTGPDRFGLVHADLRLANLLVHEESVSVIDFDDCGYSWFMYDFATAVSFIEDHPDLAGMRDRWIEGYTSVRSLTSQDIEILPTLVMLRRLLLVSWIGGHSQTELAQQMGEEFTRTSADLAEAYLELTD
jgi:Ser/Thr protein kinase RdoA (MazF antagonist)